MKFKITSILLTAASVLLLTSCGSSTKSLSASNTPDANATYTTSASNASAQTYGVSQSAGYQTNAMGYTVNAMTAPANQTYYFAFAKSNMRSNDMNALHIQARYLANHPKARVRLEGNTDNRGSREYNIGLGWRRDQSVARILEQRGVQPNQIQMVSYGKQNPAVSGDNERAWALNRRAVLIYKRKG